MMKGTTMIWDNNLQSMLDEIVSVFRNSIIVDAELFSKYQNSDKVSNLALEIAIYKSVMTLNETNKSVICRQFGPHLALDLIRNIEDNSITDVSLAIIEEMDESDLNNLPPDIQNEIKDIKNFLNTNDDEEEKET